VNFESVRSHTFSQEFRGEISMASITKLPNNNLEMPYFYNISGTVGPNKKNLHQDVALIQYLLKNRDPYPRNGLAFVYLDKRDHIGTFGKETAARLDQYLKAIAKSWNFVNLNSFVHFERVKDAAAINYPQQSKFLLMHLNASMFIHNPGAFAIEEVRKAIPNLPKE
jgi:hypothetical protein